MKKHLHIVCPDSPAPPDYGGVIDLFYKIKSLAEAGIVITLHYFDYNKNRGIHQIAPYCNQVFAYKRKPFLQSPTFSKPHIVASRINALLIARLNADNCPVLIEYIHCTGILPYLQTVARTVVARLHNDEAVYYKRLADADTSIFKRLYYQREGTLLQRYQQMLPADLTYLAVSQKDAFRFKEVYGLKNVSFLPVFTSWQEVNSRFGFGSYCLYHGNLSVAENEAAARWLIEHIFSKVNIPLVITGKNVPPRLMQVATRFKNISVQSSPTDAALTQLIREAHVHVLPDFNNTGVKLKLLHALFEGRFCITNNTELIPDRTLALAQTPAEYMGVLKSFMDQPFTEAHITERKKMLAVYNNQQNAQQLIALLY